MTMNAVWAQRSAPSCAMTIQGHIPVAAVEATLSKWTASRVQV